MANRDRVVRGARPSRDAGRSGGPRRIEGARAGDGRSPRTSFVGLSLLVLFLAASFVLDGEPRFGVLECRRASPEVRGHPPPVLVARRLLRVARLRVGEQL